MLSTLISRDLYNESLFELGSLLSQRLEYSISEDIRWLDNIELERTIDAHVDALEVGGDAALAVSVESLITDDDEDILLGAIFGLSSTNSNLDIALDTAINGFKSSDVDQQIIYLYGLQFAYHSMVTEYLIPLLEYNVPFLRATTAQVLGYRGDADPHRIWPLFHDKDESVKTAAMVAVMRLGFKKAVPAMEQAVLDNKEMFDEHRLFPLLMLGSNKALEFSRRACQSANYIKPQYPIYLALGGKEEDITHILKAMEFDNMNEAVLEALGIFGSLKGLNTLIKFLSSKDDEEKLAAAKSLNQISGAQLYETLTVIEKEDEDIDAEDITGKPAANNEEKQPNDERTIEIKKDCTDKERWTNWWQENKARFDQSIRYRYGKPYSFFLVLEEIAHPQSNYEDRQRAYNELVMRSGHHIPFEPDWFVDKQIQALKKWQSWWNENKSNYTNQWMFDGR